jgi:hypothetical protein
MADLGDHRGRRLDQPRRQGALLLGRDHARSRGPLDRLPVAPSQRHLRGRDLEHRGRRRDRSRQAATSGDTVNNVRRIAATNATGTTTGADSTFTTTPPPPSAYRDTVVATPGLVSYWRLGERAGAVAVDEQGATPGTYSGAFALGDAGALTGAPDTAAGFDGATGEMTAPAGGPGAAGTLEGWFDWRAGVAVLRDHTAGGGWILAYDNGGGLSYRIGGTTFNTGRSVASVQGAWHYVAVTKNGASVSFYLDGALVHSASGAGTAAPVMPWHVMRNGTYAQYAQGHADEVAVHSVALPPSTSPSTGAPVTERDAPAPRAADRQLADEPHHLASQRPIGHEPERTRFAMRRGRGGGCLRALPLRALSTR